MQQLGRSRSFEGLEQHMNRAKQPASEISKVQFILDT